MPIMGVCMGPCFTKNVSAKECVCERERERARERGRGERQNVLEPLAAEACD